MSAFALSFRRAHAASASLLMLAVLAGCASAPGLPGRDGPPAVVPADLARTPDPEPRVEPILPGGPNKPYKVLGQSYEPLVGDVAWKQRGLASWYGQKFHGRRTASGELFSVYGVTGAHRTLPIPSYVRVRHVASGREVIVRINDRGPFHSSRVMDLSYAAALKLGIVGSGSAEVELERLTFDEIRTGAWRHDAAPRPEGAPSIPEVDPILALASAGPGPAGVGLAKSDGTADVKASGDAALPGTLPASVATAPGTPTTTPTGATDRALTPAARGYWVQLAALGRREGVDALQQRVNAELAPLAPFMAVFKDSALFRLQVGPYGSREQAHDVAQTVRQALALSPMVIERR